MVLGFRQGVQRRYGEILKLLALGEVLGLVKLEGIRELDHQYYK